MNLVRKKSRELRRSTRTAMPSAAWIRLSGAFAKRRCRLIDISDTGVRLAIDPSTKVPTIFNFAMAIDSPGRPVRVKWRRGDQLGAEFLT